jgi:drug/metabolite transporter (DMT)-like permease
VLLALAAAAGYGASDFAAGVASRQASVLVVTFLATVSALVLTLLVLPWLTIRAPSAAALGWGAAAGLGGMTGAIALYVGFRHAAFSVAGPLSAVSAAGLSVIAGVVLGERPSAPSLAGIAVALPAIVLVSLTAAPPGPGDPAPAGSAPGQSVAGHRGAWAGVAYGLAAGTGFALLFVGLNRAGSRAGIWPVVSGQVAETLVMACIVALPGVRPRRSRPRGAFEARQGGTPGIDAVKPFGKILSGTTALAVITGVTGGGATILYFFATHHGFLAITAVLTSLYPAVTIGLARLLAGERLSATRLGGLALAGISVTLIALGGTA